jgi:NADH-quinone oxidoreductase subunit A
VIFAALVFESFVYLIGNGALEWGPIKALRRNQIEVSPKRTAATTVRRVGLEGRDLGAEREPAVAGSPGEAA